jgi:hypothetical protein
LPSIKDGSDSRQERVQEIIVSDIARQHIGAESLSLKADERIVEKPASVAFSFGQTGKPRNLACKHACLCPNGDFGRVQSMLRDIFDRLANRA